MVFLHTIIVGAGMMSIPFIFYAYIKLLLIIGLSHPTESCSTVQCCFITVCMYRIKID